MRTLKIAEKNVQVAHRELNFVAADIATLRYLTDQVVDDPSCNDRATLRRLLIAWHDAPR